MEVEAKHKVGVEVEVGHKDSADTFLFFEVLYFIGHKVIFVVIDAMTHPRKPSHNT